MIFFQNNNNYNYKTYHVDCWIHVLETMLLVQVVA